MARSLLNRSAVMPDLQTIDTMELTLVTGGESERVERFRAAGTKWGAISGAAVMGTGGAIFGASVSGGLAAAGGAYLFGAGGALAGGSLGYVGGEYLAKGLDAYDRWRARHR
jgi:hypothetical protein